MTKKTVLIIDSLRTPLGGVGKSLKDVSAVQLASIVTKEILQRTKCDKDSIDEVVLGNAVGAGLGQNPARQSVIHAGLSPKTSAYTIDMVCGSGLKSVILAAQSIISGDADLVLAGGTESASNSPYLLNRNNKKEILDKNDLRDSLIYDGLWCNLCDCHMGEIAEYTAKKFAISRQEQDLYAYESQQKACQSQEQGLFKPEIVPVMVDEGQIFSNDEKPRKNTTLERMARIPPVFFPDGTVTAGNSPAPADGAALVLLASENRCKMKDFVPIARIEGYASVAVEPKLVFSAPSIAIEQCLKKTSLELKDIDLFEINEAFAVQALLTMRNVALDKDRVNIFGGTIALGHPLGASGSRGLVTLLNSLNYSKKEVGLLAICLGGGGAVAMIVRML